MKGFKEFLLRGNLVELAVAFIIGSAFAKVIAAFVTIVMDLIGKVCGSKTSFSAYQPGGVHVGDFITEVISFVIIAAVVYFGLVKPYEKFNARFAKKDVEVGETELSLLAEIRDELRTTRR